MFKKSFKKFMTLVAMAIAGFGLVLGSSFSQQAQASGYRAINAWNSDTSIVVYNHSGCINHSQHLYPGQRAALDHDWKTFWLPAHHSARMFDKTTGYWYTIHNPNGYHICKAFGKYFSPLGWSATVYRNS